MLISLRFVSLLTSPWAEVSCEKLCGLTGLEDISIGQPKGILMSWGRVHFAETEKSFLLLEMQPERECSGSWCTALSQSSLHAGEQFCLQKTAFLYSNLSNLGLNQVRLVDLDVGQNF